GPFSHGGREAVNGRMGRVRFHVSGRPTMATTLFVVKATIRTHREDAINRAYNEEHVPHVSQFKRLVRARRYKALEGEETYQYMARHALREGARSVAPPLAGRPGAGARRRAHPSPPALRATRLDRGRHRGTGRRRARAPLAPVRARDGDARRTHRRGGRNVMVNVLTVVATL